MKFMLKSYNRLTKVTTSVVVGGVVENDYARLYSGSSFIGVTKKSMFESGDVNKVWVYPSDEHTDFSIPLLTLADTIAYSLFIRETQDYIIMPCRICNNFDVEYAVIYKVTGDIAKGTCDREAYRDGYVETQYPEIGSCVTVKGKRWFVLQPYDGLDMYLCQRNTNTKIMGRKTIVKW